MDWSWSDGGWWWMAIAMVVFWALVAGLGAWLVMTLARRPSADAPSRRAEEILAERYARGEIDDEEYHHRVHVLRH